MVGLNFLSRLAFYALIRPKRVLKVRACGKSDDLNILSKNANSQPHVPRLRRWNDPLMSFNSF